MRPKLFNEIQYIQLSVYENYFHNAFKDFPVIKYGFSFHNGKTTLLVHCLL